MARLLIADDVATNRMLLAGLAETLGHDCVEAADGAGAIEALSAGGIDLVLLDVRMPGIDGPMVLGRMKAHPEWRHLPVVMVSAFDERELVLKCLAAGADDYLVKPVDVDLLRARLGACLERKRLLDDLRGAEAGRDGLFHMVVHDLNNPLGRLLGRVDLLMEAAPEHHDDLARVRAAAVDIGRLVQGILDVARLESGVLAPRSESVDLAAVAREVVDARLDDAVVKRVTLSLDAPSRATVIADRELVSRVLHNLVGNGLEHTAAGAEVRVEVSAGRVDVRDDGSGIPEDARARVFEKFVQLAPGVRRGSGLGLAFCRLAAEAMGGGVECLPSEGGGWFRLTLVEGAH